MIVDGQPLYVFLTGSKKSYWMRSKKYFLHLTVHILENAYICLNPSIHICLRNMFHALEH